MHVLLESLNLDTIEEHDEDDSDDSVAADVKASAPAAVSRLDGVSLAHRQLFDSILPDDVPHAFSHYTFVYSKRDALVCDLQGVLTLDSPPVFELTDPAIHSSQGRMFGKTDHGRKGFAEFFKTHKCNPLCEALGLKNH
jgi:hypothetical protein